jgi:hypothetical protein
MHDFFTPLSAPFWVCICSGANYISVDELLRLFGLASLRGDGLDSNAHPRADSTKGATLRHVYARARKNDKNGVL